MAFIDVTKDVVPTQISAIHFISDEMNESTEDYLASTLEPCAFSEPGFTIRDECDYVTILNKQHAEWLIKAVKKAIELGWVE